MRDVTTLPYRAPTAALLVIVSAIAGCEVVLDAHEATLDPTCCTGGVGGNGSTSSTGGGVGTGGQPTAGFSFAITDASVNVPYGGFNYVNVEITRTDGFAGAVNVTAQGAPSGLVTMPLNIPAGSNAGKFQVSAETVLTLGNMFTLKLTAISGSIVQTASVPAVVTGKPGDFDKSFGGNGLVAGVQGLGNAGGATLYDVKELDQGNIVAAGNKYDSQGRSSAIGLRFLPSGMPDPSFNTTGIVSNSSCNCVSYYDVATSVAREVDGTLLFVGYGNPSAGAIDDIFLFRYKDDGAPDPVSGDQGIEDISLGGSELVNVATLVPSTTKLVVAGAKDGQLFVARIPDSLAGGVPDNTFAAPNGWITPPLGGVSSSAGALTFDSMGRIIVTGWVMSSSMDADVAVLRLTPDGALDSTFMGGGVMKLARPGNQNGSAVLVQPDGSILVAADTDEEGSYQLLLQRFLPSGAPDSTFGKQGVVLAPLGGTTPVLPAGPSAWMVLMLDGRIVVAGNPNTFGSAGSMPVFARVLPNGSLDPTFGTNGLLTAYVGDFGALGAMTLAGDGKLLIAGSNGSGPSTSFVARLWN